jgi:hypothetical protein
VQAHVARGVGIALAVLLGIVIVVGSAAAGAASAPAPEPVAVLTTVDPEPDTTSPPPVRRRAALGHIVGMRGRFLAVKVPSQEKPIVVAIRPETNLRVNRRPAALEDLQVGDYIVVAGRVGPQGNLVARALNIVRRP